MEHWRPLFPKSTPTLFFLLQKIIPTTTITSNTNVKNMKLLSQTKNSKNAWSFLKRDVKHQLALQYKCKNQIASKPSTTFMLQSWFNLCGKPAIMTDLCFTEGLVQGLQHYLWISLCFKNTLLVLHKTVKKKKTLLMGPQGYIVGE